MVTAFPLTLTASELPPRGAAAALPAPRPVCSRRSLEALLLLLRLRRPLAGLWGSCSRANNAQVFRDTAPLSSSFWDFRSVCLKAKMWPSL